MELMEAIYKSNL